MKDKKKLTITLVLTIQITDATGKTRLIKGEYFTVSGAVKESEKYQLRDSSRRCWKKKLADARLNYLLNPGH